MDANSFLLYVYRITNEEILKRVEQSQQLLSITDQTNSYFLDTHLGKEIKKSLKWKI